MPPDPKTKIRPQQSCLKCRERKVKCDRSIPCHACIIRGLEAECTYLTTPEDREHISQAEIIDRLRREVAQLRTQLSQNPKPKKSKRAPSAENARARPPYARPYAPQPATALLETADTNWSASSPESTGTTGTLTHSAMTVNSPDSTGSGAGSGSVASQSHALSGSTGPFGTQMTEVDAVTSAAFIGANFMDDATLSHCQGGIPAFAPADIPTSIPMNGLQSQVDPTGIPTMYHDDGPHYTMSEINNTQYMPTSHAQDYLQMVPNGDMTTYGKAQAYPQNHWGHVPESAPARPYTDSYYSSIQAFAHTNADPHANMVHPAQGHAQSPPAPGPTQDVPSQLAGLQIPSSWKGDGKQALLETLLETIGSCDESQVAQVVQVVRTSATPEEAVSGICQVLGISASATTAGRESH